MGKKWNGIREERGREGEKLKGKARSRWNVISGV